MSWPSATTAHGWCSRLRDSTEYTLPIDERLRAAVRNDRARLGQIEIEVESHLRPRDIAAGHDELRFRQGAMCDRW
ncbi:hypothetical protein SANTM175S_06735 [Streptomyces antimycoticus]